MGYATSSFRPIFSRQTFAIVALMALLSPTGCAFLQSSGSVSDSSGSFSDSSDSVSNSSESSSGSSSGEDDVAYREDVRDFATALANAKGSPTQLRRGLTSVALGRGISDWEAIDGTYAAVGEGLALAGVNQSSFIAYQSAVASQGTSGFHAIGAAYDSADDSADGSVSGSADDSADSTASGAAIR